MLPFFLLSFLCVFQCITSEFTFRNVIVTCDLENLQDDEISFSTIITTNRLQPHLPDQKCYKISMQYSTIPVLRKNSLSDINGNFLLLENNNIEEIEIGAFRNTKLTEALSLKNNKLREIRREVFNELQVPILILSSNSISYIDYQAFENMTFLESIQLDHNKISTINTFWFRQTPKLNQINLQYNLIEEIPENAFQNLAVKKLRPLKIDLSHNLIRFIHSKAFAKIKKFQTLNLAFNRLYMLDKNWLKGIKINILDISNNFFRCLEYGLAEPYGINIIDGNPWECQCLQDMKMKEMVVFGKLEANEAFKKCNNIH